MIDNIKVAAKNFCTHQLSMECHNTEEIPQMRTFIAYIDIETQSNEKFRVFLAANEQFMQNVATLFLEEEKSDEETLKDMVLETANLIIGSAKVLAQDSDNPYSIGTPYFQSIAAFNVEYDEVAVLSYEQSKLIIAIKDLNAA